MDSEVAKASQVESSHGVIDLDLKLSLSNDEDSQQESGTPKLAAANSTTPSSEKRSDSGKVFPCTYCKRVFSTYHGLGGHQRAHTEERELAKQMDTIANSSFTLPSFRYYPHSTFSSYPYVSPLRSPLGVRLDSMIRKPSYNPWIPSRSGGNRPGHGFPRLYPRPTFNGIFNVDNGGFAISEPLNSSRTGPVTTFAATSQARIEDTPKEDDSEIDLTLKL